MTARPAASSSDPPRIRVLRVVYRHRDRRVARKVPRMPRILRRKKVQPVRTLIEILERSDPRLPTIRRRQRQIPVAINQIDHQLPIRLVRHHNRLGRLNSTQSRIVPPPFSTPPPLAHHKKNRRGGRRFSACGGLPRNRGGQPSNPSAGDKTTRYLATSANKHVESQATPR